MRNCILCYSRLSTEEINLGFDICENCEEDNSYNSAPSQKFTKMRTEKETFKKKWQRPRNLDKFDSIDIHENFNEE